MNRLTAFAAALLALLSVLSGAHGAAESVTGQLEARDADNCATNDDCSGGRVCSSAQGVCLENVKSDVTDGVSARGDVGDVGDAFDDQNDQNDQNDKDDANDLKLTIGSGGHRVAGFNGAVMAGGVLLAFLFAPIRL
jgi:hypothetical protein